MMKKLLFPFILSAFVFNSCIIKDCECDECYVEDKIEINFVYSVEPGLNEYTICVSDGSKGIPVESEYYWYFNGGDPRQINGPDGGCSDFDVSIFSENGIDVSISLVIVTPDGKQYSEVKEFHLD